jgi:hypothetical protein
VMCEFVARLHKQGDHSAHLCGQKVTWTFSLNGRTRSVRLGIGFQLDLVRGSLWTARDTAMFKCYQLCSTFERTYTLCPHLRVLVHPAHTWLLRKINSKTACRGILKLWRLLLQQNLSLQDNARQCYDDINYLCYQRVLFKNRSFTSLSSSKLQRVFIDFSIYG